MLMRARGAMVRPVAAAMVLLVVAAACGSTSSKGSGTTAPSATLPANLPTTLGTGVTANTIKIGVVAPDFKCFQAFVDQIRTNEKNVWQAYFDGINNAGGINGRKVVMDFKQYCPVPGTGVQASTLCTAFTDDDHVFAVMGTLADFSGDTQGCITGPHKTILMSFLLDKQWIDKAPPGLLLAPDIVRERRVDVILGLMKRNHTLQGKKVAVLGEAVTKDEVKSTVEPGLKNLGVKTGTTAILSINGSDTQAAQQQLDSFIERWKSDGVDALFMVGQQVSSKQFVEKIKQKMPNVTLIADNGEVLGYGQDYVVDHIKNDPYKGILSADGEPGAVHDQGANYKKCAAIYKAAFHKDAPHWDTVIPGPNKKTIDTYGLLEDACTLTQMFAAIAQKAGPHLNNATWTNAVWTIGSVPDMDTHFASLGKGKYDADDTFRLVAMDPTIGNKGDWKGLTPVEDVSGGVK
jgi:ABC-type branched-subunit amino acid transport system substrate-binding protein